MGVKPKIIRLVHISDTHGKHKELNIPDGDILIHSGDWSNTGSIKEVSNFLTWFSELPHPNKIFICGNHEREVEKDGYYLFKSMIPNNVVYLEDSGIKIEGLYFYGSPWTQAFQNWGWMWNSEEEERRIWARIPEHTDVLITHSPAYRLLDFSTYKISERSDQNIGSKILRKAVEYIKPLLVAHGHVHSAYGVAQFGKTTILNGSICDEAYHASNKPKVVDIDVKSKKILQVS